MLFSSGNSTKSPPDRTLKAELKKVQLITDGSCIGNPGPGGWACILRYGGKKREIFGSEPETTNNRMELLACVTAMEHVRDNVIGIQRVQIVTDSSLMTKGNTAPCVF